MCSFGMYVVTNYATRFTVKGMRCCPKCGEVAGFKELVNGSWKCFMCDHVEVKKI